MGLFDKLFGKKTEPVKVEPPKEKKPRTPRKPKEKKTEPGLTQKELATQKGEPYVNVLRMELDPDNIHNGAFELDFNEIFVARLVKAGYMKKPDDTDVMIVDRWFQDVCRTIVLEMYEQQQADPSNRDTNVRPINSRDLGNGRTEVS